MTSALWLAAMLWASWWASVAPTMNAEKGALGGAAVGTGIGAAVGRGTPPIVAAGTPVEQPDRTAILRALPRVHGEREDIDITVEKLVDKLDPPRFYPLVGPAQLHRLHWKCTVHFTQRMELGHEYSGAVIKRKRAEVVYIDTDRLQLWTNEKELSIDDLYGRLRERKQFTHPSLPFEIRVTSVEGKKLVGVQLIKKSPDGKHTEWTYDAKEGEFRLSASGKKLVLDAKECVLASNDGTRASVYQWTREFDLVQPAQCQPAVEHRVVACWDDRVHVSDDLVHAGSTIPMLKGSVYIFGLAGAPVVAKGDIEVEGRDASGQLFARWRFDQAVLSQLQRTDRIGVGYTLTLPLDGQRVKDMKLTLTYRPAQGQACSDEPTRVTLRTMQEACKPYVYPDAREHAIEYRLKQPISLNFRDVPLRQAIRDIAVQSGIQVIPDMGPLMEDRVNLDAPISLKVEDIEMKAALNMLLKPLRLMYIIEDQVLKITTAPINRRATAVVPALHTTTSPGHPAVAKQQIQFSVTLAQVSPGAIDRTKFDPNGQMTKASEINFRIASDKSDLLDSFRKLRESGKAKILAEPSIMTLNGRPAIFLTGGEKPALQTSGSGPVVSYKQLGTKVGLQATVRADGKIHLEVRPEVTQPGADARSSSCNVAAIIGDGHTLAILCPGYLTDKGTEQDLVLLVTPHLIRSAVEAVETTASRKMSIADVVTLSKRGLAEDIIVRQIVLTESNFQLTVADLLHLHEQGVSTTVIRTMQERRMPPAPVAAPTPPTPPSPYVIPGNRAPF